jgi:hypothetical protein
MTTINLVIGAFLGAASSFFGSYALRRREVEDEKQNLASAFLGEIEALRLIVEKRHYIEDFARAIEHVRQTGQPYWHGFRTRREPFNVFRENVGKIGMLDSPLPELIVRYYTQGQAILEDMGSISEGTFNHLDANQCLDALTQIHALFVDTRTLGQQIVSEIKAKYPSIKQA